MQNIKLSSLHGLSFWRDESLVMIWVYVCLFAVIFTAESLRKTQWVCGQAVTDLDQDQTVP